MERLIENWLKLKGNGGSARKQREEWTKLEGLLVDWWDCLSLRLVCCLRGYGRHSRTAPQRAANAKRRKAIDSWNKKKKEREWTLLRRQQSLFLNEVKKRDAAEEERSKVNGAPSGSAASQRQPTQQINQLTSQKGREVKVDLNLRWLAAEESGAFISAKVIPRSGGGNPASRQRQFNSKQKSFTSFDLIEFGLLAGRQIKINIITVLALLTIFF